MLVSNADYTSSAGGIRTLVIRRLLATCRLLLGRRVAIDVLLLGGALARGLLGRGSGRTLVAILLLRCSSGFLARRLLGSAWNSAVRSWGKLGFDLGPGVPSRARVGHTSIGGELVVINLWFV